MINVAIEATKQAGQLAYRYFKKKLKVTYKADSSPVTQADIEAEKLIRKIISQKFPDHGIIGEELPPVNPKAQYQWIIDPVDGTRDFIRNLPYWATLLAVLKNGKAIIGLAYYPSSNELFVAQRGRGTYLNGKKTRVSKVSDIKLTYIVHGSINRFEKIGKLKGLVKLGQNVQGRRSLGSFNYNLLLRGLVDADLEPAGAIYDFAAPAILVAEAGGKFTDFAGKESLTSGNAVATNGLLHDQVLQLLNS